MSRYCRAEGHGTEHFNVAGGKAWQKSNQLADREYLAITRHRALAGVRGQLGGLSLASNHTASEEKGVG